MLYPGNNFKLINILGIDGAGKTTLACNLTSYFQKGDISVQYKYCQYFAKLLLPLKLIVKYTVMRKTDEFNDYSNYNRTKKKTSSHHKLLANIYATVWMVDYIIQIFFKVTMPLFFNKKKFIIDRYIYDIAVNLSLTTNNDIQYAYHIISWFYKFVPKPDRIFFIDIPEEVALSRKNDIQDIEYLRERRERYILVATKYGFKTIIGLNSQEEMLKETLNFIEQNESA